MYVSRNTFQPGRNYSSLLIYSVKSTGCQPWEHRGQRLYPGVCPEDVVTPASCPNHPPVTPLLSAQITTEATGSTYPTSWDYLSIGRCRFPKWVPTKGHQLLHQRGGRRNFWTRSDTSYSIKGKVSLIPTNSRPQLSNLWWIPNSVHFHGRAKTYADWAWHSS